MHPNPAYRGASDAQNLAFARERGFGILAISDDAGPLLSHVPFLLDEAGTGAELHLVRSNPIAAAVQGPVPAAIAVSGPDGYVSPDWYEMPDQVPTWNYVAVHLRGTLVPLPQDEMRPMLDRLSAHFEAPLSPKRPWNADKMGDGVMDRMMRMILPYRLEIAKISGTWKLNQNKPDPVRLRAAQQMGAYGLGHETRLLAALMHQAGKPPTP